MNDITTLDRTDSRFPTRFIAIGADCPARIYCIGNLDILNHINTVAVIGARRCDRAGYRRAYELAYDQAKTGAVVVSGLALGCDTAAHWGAIDAGGRTIAVVGNGLNHAHPKENAQLQAKIIETGGLIVSEQRPDIHANPTTLIARNRLQAALSDIVILAQCPNPSGSLHTMCFARKYHKSCQAATYPRPSDYDAGNRYLIEENLARPI